MPLCHSAWASLAFGEKLVQTFVPVREPAVHKHRATDLAHASYRVEGCALVPLQHLTFLGFVWLLAWDRSHRESGDTSAFVRRHKGHLRIFKYIFPPRYTGPFSTRSLHVYVLDLDSELLCEPHLASTMATQQHTGTPIFPSNPLACSTRLDQQKQITEICPKQSDSVKLIP